MELRQYIQVLIKWWWLLAATVIVTGAASWLATRAVPRTYLSRTTLMVGQTLQNPNPTQAEFSTGQVLAQSYADLTRREPVLRATLQALGLPWQWGVLKEMVSTRVVPGTQLFEISVVDTDPKRAQVLADEIAQQVILTSPAAADAQKEAEHKFTLSQIDDLKANISRSQDELRQLDDVVAKATSAKQIQEARGRQVALQAQISSWQSIYAQLQSNLQRGAPNFLSVVEPAQAPTFPIGPRTTYNVLLASLVGLVLAGGAAFLLEYVDDTLKSPDDVRQALGLPALGAIARIEGQAYPDKLIVQRFPRSPTAEAYRVLRTNLHFSASSLPLRTLMITSASPQEGKSVTAANLAVAMAQSGRRVVLVDADMRRPSQHHIFDVDNAVGLATALQDATMGLSQVLQATRVPNLSVLTSGPLPDNPAELLGAPRLSELIEWLGEYADVVIVDSPPVMAVTDAAILSARLDGTLLVVDAGGTRRGLAQRSQEALRAVGGRLLGVVLNRLSARDGEYTHYYYYVSEDGQRRRRRSASDAVAHLFKRSAQDRETPEVVSPESKR
jgi:non-specific protein-tyrosine kinase